MISSSHFPISLTHLLCAPKYIHPKSQVNWPCTVLLPYKPKGTGSFI